MAEKINVGKFINNLDSEDLSSEKLQGVVGNVYAKAIKDHKTTAKKAEDNLKDKDKETVEFTKSNHDRLKAHKNKPEKDLNKDDAPVEDKVVKDINESVEDEIAEKQKQMHKIAKRLDDMTAKNPDAEHTLKFRRLEADMESLAFEIEELKSKSVEESKKQRSPFRKVNESHDCKRNYKNVRFASQEIEKKGYSHKEANDIALKLFDNIEGDTQRSLEWHLEKILPKEEFDKEYPKNEGVSSNAEPKKVKESKKTVDNKKLTEAKTFQPMTLREYGKKFLDGYLDTDVYDTEIDMGVAFVFDCDEEPTDNYEKFLSILADNVMVKDAFNDGALTCDFSGFYKPYNDKINDWYKKNGGHQEFEGEEGYYDLVLATEGLVSGSYSEEDYKELCDIFTSKKNLVGESLIKESAEKIQPGNIYSVLVKELPAEDIDHHYSDLYVRKTPKSTEIVNRLTTKSLLSTFKDNIDGDIWYELPFCYTPYFGESKKLTETPIPRNATKIKVGGKEFTKEKDWVDGNRVHVSPKDIKRLYGDDVEVLETDPNYKSKRTKEVKVLQGNYGYGWDDLVEYDKEDSAELKQDLRSYRENERNAQFRVITRRVPLGEEKLSEGAKPSELWYNKKEVLNNIWGLVCEGDDRLEDIRYIFESGLLKPNEFRYDGWGAKHSLIMGALRNGNYKAAELLKSLGEKILKSEVEEYKDLMARKVYSDETTRDALDETKSSKKLIKSKELTEGKKIDLYVNGEYVCSSTRYKRVKDFVDAVKKDGKVTYAGLDNNGKLSDKVTKTIKDTDKVVGRIVTESKKLTEEVHDGDMFEFFGLQFSLTWLDHTGDEPDEFAIVCDSIPNDYDNEPTWIGKTVGKDATEKEIRKLCWDWIYDQPEETFKDFEVVNELPDGTWFFADEETVDSLKKEFGKNMEWLPHENMWQLYRPKEKMKTDVDELPWDPWEKELDYAERNYGPDESLVEDTDIEYNPKDRAEASLMELKQKLKKLNSLKGNFQKDYDSNFTDSSKMNKLADEISFINNIIQKYFDKYSIQESLTEDLSKIQEEQTMKLIRLLGKGLITKQEFEQKLYGIIDNDSKLVRTPMFKNIKIKDFYTDNYPEDDLGEEINDTVTVDDVVDTLNNGGDLYKLIGVTDSIVRERLFEFIADICNTKYDRVYKKWLEESLVETGKKFLIESQTQEIEQIMNRLKKDFGPEIEAKMDEFVNLPENSKKVWKSGYKIIPDEEIEKDYEITYFQTPEHEPMYARKNDGSYARYGQALDYSDIFYTEEGWEKFEKWLNDQGIFDTSTHFAISKFDNWPDGYWSTDTERFSTVDSAKKVADKKFKSADVVKIEDDRNHFGTAKGETVRFKGKWMTEDDFFKLRNSEKA